MNTSALLKLLSLLQAGFDMAALASEVRAMEDAGKTQEEIYKWIDDNYDEALAEVNATP